jgi:DNA-binding NarL/FixJ family response regulator
METIAVSVIEDHRPTLEALAVLLNGTPGFRCHSTHRNGEGALKAIPISPPDVVVIDLMLPKVSGVDCVRSLKAQLPNTPIMALTVFEDTDLVFKVLEAGADGYVMKTETPSKILECIRQVHLGGAPMSSEIAAKLVQYFHEKGKASAAQPELTPRELETLNYLSQGLLYKEIAEPMGISVQTVNTHVKSIYSKLQVRSRTEAVTKFLRH